VWTESRSRGGEAASRCPGCGSSEWQGSKTRDACASWQAGPPAAWGAHSATSSRARPGAQARTAQARAEGTRPLANTTRGWPHEHQQRAVATRERRGVSVSASADGAARGAALKRPRRPPARRQAANGRRASQPGERSRWCLGADRAGRISGDQILSKVSSGHPPNHQVH